jgi:hypothetical protein
LAEPDVGFAVVDREQGGKGRQLFVVDVDGFADGDGVHGAAVFAFGGDGTFAFAAVLAGDFGAFLFSSAVRIFCMVVPPDLKVGGGMEEPDRGEGGAGGKYLIKGVL